MEKITYNYINNIHNISNEVTFKDYLEQILNNNSLNYDDSFSLMHLLLNGKLDDIEISSLLTALRSRDIKSEELSGFCDAMLSFAAPFEYDRNKLVIDIVGTGGAPFKTFNVSTTSSFVLPLLGVSVAKHGNRSSTSKSGSADLLEALGVNLDNDKTLSQKTFEETGFAYLFAPNYHPAMKKVIKVRKILKIRTIFNLLGPLTNPARVTRQLTGLFDPDLLKPVAVSLKQREFERVALVHSEIGADEITNVGKTRVVELNNSTIKEYSVMSENFGLKDCNPQEISALLPLDAAEEAIKILSGYESPRADFVAANAAMAVRIAGLENDLIKATEMVKEVLVSGRALGKLKEVIIKLGGSATYVDEIREKF
jgi:anthranilate phosphoribosyltransferase